MKLINSRGRLLLHVYRADLLPDGRVLYLYTGDGCGGYSTPEGIERTAAAIQADAPSARRIGTLPAPVPIAATRAQQREAGHVV